MGRVSERGRGKLETAGRGGRTGQENREKERKEDRVV